MPLDVKKINNKSLHSAFDEDDLNKIEDKDIQNNNDLSLTIKLYNKKSLNKTDSEVMKLTDKLKKKGYSEGKKGQKHFYFSSDTLTLNSKEDPKKTGISTTPTGQTSFETLAYGSGFANKLQNMLPNVQTESLKKQIDRIHKLLK
jgi:hypothetical protein